MKFLVNNKYYIIRTGDFAVNANKKIVYTIYALILCIDDYINNKSNDCFKIMLGSTLIWTIIEYLLYISDTRIIKPMFINYGQKRFELPKYLALLLQGLQEGGVVSTFGLYFGDRFFDYRYNVIYNMFMINMVMNMNNKQTIINNLSKRQINTLSSVIPMGIVTMFNIYCIYKYPEHTARSLNMALSMFYMSTIWTTISYIKGFRKVISLEYKNNNYHIGNNIERDAFLVLAYDIIFEICSAYLTFYNLFIIKVF